MLEGKKIAVVGGGKMGGALIEGMISGGLVKRGGRDGGGHG